MTHSTMLLLIHIRINKLHLLLTRPNLPSSNTIVVVISPIINLLIIRLLCLQSHILLIILNMHISCQILQLLLFFSLAFPFSFHTFTHRSIFIYSSCCSSIFIKTLILLLHHGIILHTKTFLISKLFI